MNLFSPIAVTILVVVASCDMALWEPDVGAPQQAFCVDEDSDKDTDVSFAADIVPSIFDPDRMIGFGCLDCHSRNGETPIGLEVGGLDLASYAGLRQGGLVSGSNVVVPGRPCSSILYQKVSPGAPFGARMPLDGPPYLDDEARTLIHDWISEGALDN